MNCLKEPDPLKYPSQILCMVNEVLFCSRCEEGIKKQQLEQLKKSLKVIELTVPIKINNNNCNSCNKNKLMLLTIHKLYNLRHFVSKSSVISKLKKNINFII